MLSALRFLLCALLLCPPLGAQSLALDVFDGDDFAQVDVPLGANSLLGFDSTGQPARVTAGTGISISGNVITSSGGGSTSLSGLADVTLSSPAADQLLRYNSASEKWVNWTPNFQSLDDQLTALAALEPSTLANLPYFQSGAAQLAFLSSFARTLIDDTSSSAMRTTLGLGSMATQANTAVSIFGGSMVLSDDLEFRDYGGGSLTMVRNVADVDVFTRLRVNNPTNVDLYLPSSGTVILSDTSYATTSAFGAVELATDGETAAGVVVQGSDARLAKAEKLELGFAISDETTALTTGTAKLTFNMPCAMTLSSVVLTLNTVSSSGTPTVDINEAGSTILSTKLTCDVSEDDSRDATTPAVISDTSLADKAKITFDIDTAGTAATGAKVWLIGTRN